MSGINKMNNWKTLVKKIICLSFGKNISKIDIYEDIQILSFDIYDTLVFRKTKQVDEVFEIVQKRYIESYGKRIDFYKRRKHAEELARKKKGRKEVSYDEIYEELPDLSVEEKNVLKEIELQTEYEVSAPNTEMVAFFNEAKRKNFRLVITSDMYLPQETIIKILKKCGISGYSDLFLSSYIGVRKRTGDMYKYISNRYNLPLKYIFHIGDNAVSDFFIPITLGARAFLYKTDMK